MSKSLCVIGLGYIGLPTAAIFASAGWDVIGVDINPMIVEKLNQGKIHIEETGLEDAVQKAVAQGKLRAQLEPTNADCFIIAVPTPINSDNIANIDYVLQATKAILPFIKQDNVIIIESTIPPRTIDDKIVPIFQEEGWRVGENIYLAYCPERVLPGRILTELVENSRIVGGVNEHSAQKAADVYKTFVKGTILTTTTVNAEMVKLMENTYRDVNIALVNELVKICDHLHIDALEVIKFANFHPRVNLHLPGPGVGGHCIAVDPYFIIEKAPNQSVLISNAREINNSMPSFVIEKVKKLVPNVNTKIAVFGLSYKGNNDDVRESPAVSVLKLLQLEGYHIAVYDPHVNQNQIETKLTSFEEAITDAECILVLTDHNEFKDISENRIIHLMKKPVIFDTRNCIEVKDNRISYFNYGKLP
ncbi:nucleotide sugar dehydrogenase [Cytobacillus dafuensis]|uniref:Nucleotide sugar dehydrogenase n=1 Tax=Cytobacillus dafuensis TaxID=1742359 RepID=A0A5B8Z8B7_CYTDA|nr:nucleotide sugar dehydrogenase [Cytobacillus dafuensis]QED49187.1 nucleotide sugar dehydrogenase [Cytobacillus dafuensis]